MVKGPQRRRVRCGTSKAAVAELAERKAAKVRETSSQDDLAAAQENEYERRRVERERGE